MFDLRLLRIRAFAAGNRPPCSPRSPGAACKFMLIIWLQGIWLILHGYNYKTRHSGPASTAAAHVRVHRGRAHLGLSVGRHGARWFASGACWCPRRVRRAAADSTDFSTDLRDAHLRAGVGMACSPRPTRRDHEQRAARQRGAASGMRPPSRIRVRAVHRLFFSLMIVGLSSTLPTTLTKGLMSRECRGAGPPGRPDPAGGELFATSSATNPIHELLAPTGVLAHLPAATWPR